MSSQLQDGDFCLECHWEAFQMSGSELPSPWSCPGDDHPVRASCGVDEACCDVDNCSVNCSSVCDGFIDCDNSTVCSEPHCDDLSCTSTGPACFDKNCFGDGHGTDQSLEALLAQDPSLDWETAGFLPPDSSGQGDDSQAPKNEDLFPQNAGEIQSHDELFSPLSTSVDNYGHHDAHHHHLPYHGAPKESDMGLLSPSYSSQSDMTGAQMYDMLGMGHHGFSGCSHHVNAGPHCQHYGFDKLMGFVSPAAPTCHNAGYQHLDSCPRDSAESGLHHVPRGACHSHCHRHVHSHSHSQAYSPYARHSRSSVSSHLVSSPGETPPPLESGASSVLTSPDFAAEEHPLRICRWTSSQNGIKTQCGASFQDAGALQEHLVSKHMGTVDGPKGPGYYCCWAGCQRPDEPFSQKSKLQGHFLTHSNYKSFKCSVCGKPFARQATLERHERSHRGEKPYKCRECGKAFTDSSELKTHTRTHTGEKPFKCRYPGCNFQTGDSSNMSSHKLTHGERKHKCHYPGCSRSFTRPDQLKRHLRTTHKEENSARPLPSPMPEHFAFSTFDAVA
ncbi:hypothetical protein VTN02DRAFT_5358 [Thermoascus thermophilus]